METLQKRKKKWKREYDSLCWLHSLNLNLQLCLPSGISRAEKTLLCHLWLGMAFSNAYSFRIGIVNNPTCDNFSCEETFAHLLCGCPGFSEPRKGLSDALGGLDNRLFSEGRPLGTIRDRPQHGRHWKLCCASYAASCSVSPEPCMFS